MAQGRNPQWAKPLNLKHSDNFYEVVPGVLYRAAQPDEKAMREYAAFGIKSVINLRSLHTDAKIVKGTGINLYEIPMSAWDIDDEEIIAVLSVVKNADKPVLIHCQHGADRTGVAVAMYRMVFQNWSREEALDELKNGGFGFHKIWDNIPKYINKVDLKYMKRALGQN